MACAETTAAFAGKEFKDHLRNRWVWIIALLLGGASLAIYYLGASPAGVVGAQGSAATLASLVNLTIYLVPLLGLALGAGAFVEEQRRGTLDLLLSLPISSRQYFAGTFAGMSGALGLAILLGLGLPGCFMAIRGEIALADCLILVGLALGLGLVFLGLSQVISLVAGDRGKALAGALCLWIGAAFLFDLLLVGLLLVAGDRLSEGLFSGLLLLNPVDVFRLLAFKLLVGAAAALGLEAGLDQCSGSLLGAALLAWVVLPLILSQGLFDQRLVKGE